MSDNKVYFNVKVGEDKEVELVLKRPNNKQNQEADIQYSKAFTKYLTQGCVLRDKLLEVLKEQGVWSDADDKKFSDLVKELTRLEGTIHKGGYKLSEARKHALRMIEIRNELMMLQNKTYKYDHTTVESQAEFARMGYLTYACTLRKNGEPYWKSYDEYLEQENNEVAIEASRQLMLMLNGVREDFLQERPEVKFLTKYKFMDKDMRLLDKEGNFVDTKGRRINEDGRLINEDGQLIDIDGNVIDEDGNLQDVEAAPFLDDDDNPIVEEKDPEPALSAN